MLVLGRKFGQKIRIGSDITIHILQGSGNNIKVGIDAPTQIPVHREEIYEKIKGSDFVSVQKIAEMA